MGEGQCIRGAGWQRVDLAPGESRTVHIKLEPLAIASFDEAADNWKWLPGEYTVEVGGSSRNAALTAHADLHAAQ